MKLVRFGKPGKEKPGLIDADGKIRDLSGVIPDLTGEYLSPKYMNAIGKKRLSSLPVVRGNPRLGSCVAQPGNFIAIGLNYADHAAEAGMKIPSEPIIFNKAPNCIVGPNDDIMLPKGSTKTDWEVELAIVIGTKAVHVSERDALNYVAGFCVCNDVSEREYQVERSGGQWGKGKGCPTFGPLGPWLVTPDEIDNPQKLGLWLDVDGVRQQTGNTKTMIFGVKTLISYVSKFMQLDPGDVITTGTPPGVAMGRKPPNFLQAGQTLSCGIDGLGQQASRIVTWKKQA